MSVNAREPLPADMALVRPALHQALVERLRDMIVDGTLAGGDRIEERRLCESFGVSRTPLREAVLVLAAEGLIELIPRRGARVAALEPAQIRDLLEVLGGLEALAGELACARASEAEIAAIAARHAEMRARHAAGDMLSYFKINEGIHDAIVAAAHNAALAAEHRLLRARVLHALYLPNIRAARWNAALAEHEAFMTALGQRDGARLGRLLRAHKDATWEALRACLPPRVTDAARPRRSRRN
jgi:DNA-binding GntR family transcriptional regulator